jgi:hypothetical protein
MSQLCVLWPGGEAIDFHVRKAHSQVLNHSSKNGFVSEVLSADVT